MAEPSRTIPGSTKIRQKNKQKTIALKFDLGEGLGGSFWVVFVDFRYEGPPRKGSPLYVAEKVTNHYELVIGKPPISRAPQNPE